VSRAGQSHAVVEYPNLRLIVHANCRDENTTCQGSFPMTPVSALSAGSRANAAAMSKSGQVAEYKNVQRWTDAIAKRSAVKRGRMVNRINGDPASQLLERHEASDFDTKTQDKVAPG